MKIPCLASNGRDSVVRVCFSRMWYRFHVQDDGVVMLDKTTGEVKDKIVLHAGWGRWVWHAMGAVHLDGSHTRLAGLRFWLAGCSWPFRSSVIRVQNVGGTADYALYHLAFYAQSARCSIRYMLYLHSIATRANVVHCGFHSRISVLPCLFRGSFCFGFRLPSNVVLAFRARTLEGIA